MSSQNTCRAPVHLGSVTTSYQGVISLKSLLSKHPKGIPSIQSKDKKSLLIYNQLNPA